MHLWKFVSRKVAKSRNFTFLLHTLDCKHEENFYWINLTHLVEFTICTVVMREIKILECLTLFKLCFMNRAFTSTIFFRNFPFFRTTWMSWIYVLKTWSISTTSETLLLKNKQKPFQQQQMRILPIVQLYLEKFNKKVKIYHIICFTLQFTHESYVLYCSKCRHFNNFYVNSKNMVKNTHFFCSFKNNKNLLQF